VSRLSSAPVPPPSDDDHIRGPVDAPLVIEYADFECPFCAALTLKLASQPHPLRRVFRHFPVRSSHPRAWAAACAAEAAALQGRFWEMHDLLFADQGRLDDPYLWERATTLGLDLQRFDAERRGEAVLQRVKRDFESGIRAGVVSTPALFTESGMYTGEIEIEVLARLSESP